MYRKHFGLTQHPFSNEIEPEELFLATSYKELEVRLAHLIDMRGIGLVTGDSGSGKTCCCRKVLHALHASLYRVPIRVPVHRKRHGPLQNHLLGDGTAR